MAGGALGAGSLFDLWEGAVEGVSAEEAQREVRLQVGSTECCLTRMLPLEGGNTLLGLPGFSYLSVLLVCVEWWQRIVRNEDVAWKGSHRVKRVTNGDSYVKVALGNRRTIKGVFTNRW